MARSKRVMTMNRSTLSLSMAAPGMMAGIIMYPGTSKSREKRGERRSKKKKGAWPQFGRNVGPFGAIIQSWAVSVF